MKNTNSDNLPDDLFDSGRTYIKSKVNYNGFDGGVYFSKQPLDYWYREYETIVDSKGGEHSVVVSTEDRKILLRDKHISIHEYRGDYYIRTSGLCPVSPEIVYFQFNLREYALVGVTWCEYLHVYRNCVDKYLNKYPNYLVDSKLRVYDAIEVSGYAPFYEHCYGRGEFNYIPDKVFFNHPNKKIAISRVHCGVPGSSRVYNKEVFKNFDYINASDGDIVKFMNDRFKKRIEFGKALKRRHQYSFN